MSGFQCNLKVCALRCLLHSIRKNEPPYDKLKATKNSLWVPRKRVIIKKQSIWACHDLLYCKGSLQEECEATSHGYLVKCKENGHRTKIMSFSGKIIAIKSELKQDGIMAKMTTNNGYCMDFVHYNVHNNCTSHCIDW